MKRNQGVELFRVMLMFGVTVLHVNACLSMSIWGLANFLHVCVPGFAFISGYYGIHFTWKRFCGLIAVGIWCASVSAVFQFFFMDVAFSISVIVENLRGLWYLWAYLVVMSISPLINNLFECQHMTRKQIVLSVLPFLVVVFGWSYFVSGVLCKAFVGYCGFDSLLFPYPSGFGPYTFLSLLGIYVLARTYAVLCCDRYLIKLWWLVIPLIIFVFRFKSEYNSPVTVLLALYLFTLFKHFHVQLPVARLVPSLFSVYLLQCTTGGWRGMHDLILLMNAWPRFSVVIVGGLTVFFICVVIDIIRRMIVSFGHKTILMLLDLRS